MDVDNKGSLGPLSPGRKSDRVRIYRGGRVCEHPECSTILSIYNPSSRCAVHQRLADVVPLRQLVPRELERTCVQCGTPFRTSNPRRKYCSARCRSHAFAERERSARQAALACDRDRVAA